MARKDKVGQILSALRLAGDRGITNVELSKIALRYGGYLGKLYEHGYKVSKESLGNGVYKYKLTFEPDEIVVREKALDKLLAEVAKAGKVDKDQLVKLLDANSIGVKYKANTYQGS